MSRDEFLNEVADYTYLIDEGIRDIFQRNVRKCL